MQQLTWQRLALVVLVALTLAWAVTRFAANDGYTPMPVPWSVAFVSAAGAVLALLFAWPVRQYLRGKHPGLSALRAARAAVYAQAAAYAGAVLLGGFGGYGLGVAMEWAHAPRREVAISALIAAAGGLALVACGAIAEHWCRTDGTGTGGEEASGRA